MNGTTPRHSKRPPGEGTVLVVDDDTATRSLVAGWLRSAGMRALEADSGEAALAVVTTSGESIDAIVLDVMMPGMTGFDVLDRLKQDVRYERMPILFLSAAASESDVVRGVQAGAVDYLPKPFSGPILVAKVRAVVSRARAERVLESRLRTAEDSAANDALTGLANRGSFDRRLAEMMSHAVRHAEPLALLLVDIDHFKAINDRFGHLSGDAALTHLAGKLRGVTRAGDQAFRYGGEEFVLLLQRCDRVGAVAVFDRLRGSLAKDPCHTNERTLSFSVSGGVSSMEEDNSFVADGLFARADAALYAAKEGGRDRVVVEAGA